MLIWRLAVGGSPGSAVAARSWAAAVRRRGTTQMCMCVHATMTRFLPAVRLLAASAVLAVLFLQEGVSGQVTTDDDDSGGGGNWSCASGRLFLGSVGDRLADYEPLTGMFVSEPSRDTDGDVTEYRHEHGVALLRLHAADGRYMWYVTTAADRPRPRTLPAPGALTDGGGDGAVPLAYLRSVGSDRAVPPWQVSWQVWVDGVWRDEGARRSGASYVGARCEATLRARCVSAADGTCAAGRLRLTGLPAMGERDAGMVTVPLEGKLLGARQPAFSSQLELSAAAAAKTEADLVGEMDVPFPENGPPFAAVPEPAADVARPRLGTFVLTDFVHVNRPVYRHARHAGTFLYFDTLLQSDGGRLPLWIVGPAPSSLQLNGSSFLYVVDAAQRPEMLAADCWQYRAAGGRQTAAFVSPQCPHGRAGPLPLAAADCQFELAGACGYRADATGLLQQTGYDEDGLEEARQAGNQHTGRFYALIGAPEARQKEPVMATVTSPPFTAVTNSCLTLYYAVQTERFIIAGFALIDSGDNVKAMLTKSSAPRPWEQLTYTVQPGTYRLQVQARMRSGVGRLLLDGVHVMPGDCADAAGPCDAQPCHNGATCLPIDDKAYTCRCAAGFQGVDCATAVQCAPPPPVAAGRLVANSSLSAPLPWARFVCRPAGGGTLSPTYAAAALCVRGQWRGVPDCSSPATTAETEGDKAKGSRSTAARPAPSAAVMAALALLVTASCFAARDGLA